MKIKSTALLDSHSDRNLLNFYSCSDQDVNYHKFTHSHFSSKYESMLEILAKVISKSISKAAVLKHSLN